MMYALLLLLLLLHSNSIYIHVRAQSLRTTNIDSHRNRTPSDTRSTVLRGQIYYTGVLLLMVLVRDRVLDVTEKQRIKPNYCRIIAPIGRDRFL